MFMDKLSFQCFDPGNWVMQNQLFTVAMFQSLFTLEKEAFEQGVFDPNFGLKKAVRGLENILKGC